MLPRPRWLKCSKQEENILLGQKKFCDWWLKKPISSFLYLINFFYSVFFLIWFHEHQKFIHCTVLQNWKSDQIKCGVLGHFLTKLGEILVHMGNYNFTKFYQNQMKNKNVLLIARFSVQNFKVSVESWKSWIVRSVDGLLLRKMVIFDFH